MDTIILYRLTPDGQLHLVLDDDGDTAIFKGEGAAEKYIRDNRLFQSGQAVIQIISVEI